jgi:TRAP-type C4-dicarboxylate transport system substrate-binding protein
MKSKSIVFFLSVLLVFGFFAGTTFAADKVYKLRFQSYYPPPTIHGAKNFAKNVEEMSNGRIKITVFAGAELVPTPDILKAVKAGTVDMGQCAAVFFSEYGLADVGTGLPMAWKNAQEAEILYNMGLREIVAAEYERNGAYFLSEVWAAPFHMITKKPVNSIEDLKKIKVTTAGGVAMMLMNLGVGVVDMPPEDIYLGLTTGVVDGVVYGGALEYELMKLHETAKYYNITPIFDPAIDAIIINPKKWQSLPPDLQAILKGAARQARWDYYNWVLSKEYELRETIFKGNLTHFSQEDLDTFMQASIKVWDEIGKFTPEAAKGVEIVKKLNRWMGRMD